MPVINLEKIETHGFHPSPRDLSRWIKKVDTWIGKKGRLLFLRPPREILTKVQMEKDLETGLFSCWIRFRTKKWEKSWVREYASNTPIAALEGTLNKFNGFIEPALGGARGKAFTSPEEPVKTAI